MKKFYTAATYSKSQDSTSKKQKILPPDRRQFLKATAAGAIGVGMAPVASAASVSSQREISSPHVGQTKSIDVDFSKIIGTVKPLNGVNGGPLVILGQLDLSSRFSEASIPHVRLHDIPVMYDNVVDVNYIFRHPEADENNPQSYDFSLTDYYIQSIRSLGTEVTYRLGYRAEGTALPHIVGRSLVDHARLSYPQRYKAPPLDYSKWAAICSHIVQHYSHGWANGYQNAVKYWEIWNEPDVPIFWSGTAAEYYQLYGVTAKALKKLDPDINVGGPAMGYDVTKVEFLNGFLKYCRDHDVPLDFASWHIYSKDPLEVKAKSSIIREALDHYGFSATKSMMDEWNYFLGDWTREGKDREYRKWLFETQVGGPPGAAYVASVLMGLQDSSVDLADYYQGTSRYWGGLFDEFGVPRKPYFTFKAFKFLLETPQRVASSGSDDKGFTVIAGLSEDKSEGTVLISNFGTAFNRYDLSFHNLPWKENFRYERYAIDSRHNLDMTMSENLRTSSLNVSEEVQTPSVCLIRLRGSK